MIKPSTCSTCPLYTIGNSFSRPEGKGRTGVIFIGEGLGHEEALDGLPFRPKAQAGSKLEECIRLAGYARDDFLLWNIIACQPPNNRLTGMWYEQRAIQHCSQYLRKVIDDFIPPIPSKRKVILALGNTAFYNLTNSSSSVLDVRGYPFPCKWDSSITVVSSYHPSYIKRGKAELTPLLVEDIRKCVEIAKVEKWENPKAQEDDDVPF